MSCKLHYNIVMPCGHTVTVYSSHSKKECQRNVSQCKRKCVDCAIVAQDVRILKLFGSPERAKILQSLVKNPEDPEDSEDSEGN